MRKSIVAQLFVFVVMISLMDEVMGRVSAEIMNKTQMCAACHGPKGISSNPEWPNLAGQHAGFLRKQFIDYRVGKTRHAVIMTGIAASLSEEEIYSLAQYYATLPRFQGKTPKKYFILGEKIYRSGDFEKGITACIACHGPKGGGNDEAGFPMLSGQQARYTIQQLQAFKGKTRRNDLNHIMQDICGRMGQEEMEAVAYYVQGLE